MSEEQVAPTPEEVPQGTEVAPEAPVQESEPAPVEAPVEPQASEPEAPVVEPSVESGSTTVAAVEVAQAAADQADKSLREEVVEWTHHIGASILHEHTVTVDIPATSKHGPRQEQFIGR